MTPDVIKENQLLRSKYFTDVLEKYNDKLIILKINRGRIHFVSKVIREKVGLYGNGYGNWNGCEDLIVYDLSIRSDKSTIVLNVGPSDNEQVRNKWIQICKDNTDLFVLSNRQASHWKGVYAYKNFYEVGDTIEKACDKLDAFLNTTFDVIDRFFSEH